MSDFDNVIQRLNVSNALDIKPEEFARKRKIAQAVQVFPGLVTPEHEREYAVDNAMGILATAPTLQKRVQEDAEFASLAHNDFEKLAAVNRLNKLKEAREQRKAELENSYDHNWLQDAGSSAYRSMRGVINAMDLVYARKQERQLELDQISRDIYLELSLKHDPNYDIEKHFEDEAIAIQERQAKADKWRKKYEEDLPDTVPRLSAESQKQMQEFQSKEGFWESTGYLITHPRALANVGASAMGALAPALVMAAAGGYAGGTAGAMGMMGAGVFGTEYASHMSQMVEEAVHKDNRTHEDVLKDRELMRGIEREATIRGAVIGTTEAFTLGATGLIYKTIAPKSAWGAIGSSMGAQTLGGVIGEGGAQVAARGEFYDMPGIAGEAVLGPFLSLPEVGSYALFGKTQAANEHQERMDHVRDVVNAARESRLREIDPVLFQDYAARVAEESGQEHLYIDGNALDSSGLQDVLLQAMPEYVQAVQEAQATGGAVQIRTEDFLTRIAPDEQLTENLMDILRLDPDGQSFAELRDHFEAELSTSIVENLQNLSQMEESERVKNDVYDHIHNQLTATGRLNPDAARNNAVLLTAFIETMGNRMGEQMKQLYERLGVRIVGGEHATQGALDQPTTQDFHWEYGQRRGLFGHSNIQIVEITGAEFGNDRESIQAGANESLKNYPVDGLVNNDTGWNLHVTGRGRRKMVMWRGAKIPAMQSIAALESLVKNAVLAESHQDTQHGNPDVQGVHRLYAPIRINGVLHRAKLTVRDYKGEILGERTDLHFLTAVEIEDAPMGTLPTPQEISDKQAQPTSGHPEISIADLLSGSKREDGTDWDFNDTVFYQNANFYSALVREVDAIQMKSGTAQAWKEQLSGLVAKGRIKEDEVYWTGIREWLDSQEGKISREAVQEYLRGEQVVLEEKEASQQWSFQNTAGDTLYFDSAEEAQQAYDEESEWIESEAAGVDEDGDVLSLWGNDNGSTYTVTLEESQVWVDEYGDAVDLEYEVRDDWGEYTQENMDGTITVFNEDGEEKATYTQGTQEQWIGEDGREFDSREDALEYLNDRAEEVKSYYRDLIREPEIADNHNEDNGARYRSYSFAEEGQNYREVLLTTEGIRVGEYESSHWKTPNVIAHIRLTDFDGGKTLFVEELQSDWAQDKRKGNTEADAPFVDKTGKWVDLTLKRVMLEAVRGGYERVAFINGQQSADRYGLDKQISRLEYDGKILRAERKDGGGIIEREVAPQEMGATVGEETAQKLLAQETPDGVMVLEGEDLKMGGEGMHAFYDSVVPKALSKLLKKADKSIKLEAVQQQETNSEQLSFAVTDKMRETLAEGLPLFQNPQNPRGQYNPADRTVTLFENADLSTLPHELGHFFLDMMTFFANDLRVKELQGEQLTAQEQGVIRDVDTLMDWFGLTAEQWGNMTLDEQRPYHEQFARGFEQYLLEGKAPNPELQGLFARFRAWMLNIYRSAKNLNVPMTDEVRQVFDRMLANDESIALAEQNNNMRRMFEDAEAAGMTAEEYADYVQLNQDATNAAMDEMQARSMRDLKLIRNLTSKALKAIQKEAREVRETLEAEARQQLEAQPVYRVMQLLSGKSTDEQQTFRLSRRALEEMGFSADEINQIKSHVRVKDSLHPDQFAAMVFDDDGNVLFQDGEALVREMLAAKPLNEAVQDLADQMMLERYGELATPEAQLEAAQAAVHNDVRLKVLATEANALARATGNRLITSQVAKAIAQRVISQKRIRDIKPQQFLRMEARAAKAVEQARKKGDIQTAALEKRNQVLQAALARAAYEAQENAAKQVRQLKRMNSLNPKEYAIEYREQIEAILERYNLRTQTGKALQRRQSLAQWVEAEQKMGREPNLPEHVMDELNRTPWQELTVEQMQGLVNTLEQMKHYARMKNELLTAREKKDAEAVINKLAEKVIETSNGEKKDNRTATTPADAAKQKAGRLLADHIRAPMEARRIDGDVDNGIVVETLVHTADRAANVEAELNAHATKELAKILRPLMKRRDRNKKRTYEIQGKKYSFSHMEIFAIALNTGNDGNMQRLTGGEGWTEADVRGLVSNLTTEELDAVQKIWDYYRDNTKGEIRRITRRVDGVEPEWVEARPFKQIAADGSIVNMHGGYYPIVYDTQRSPISYDLQMQDLQNGRSGYTAVREGFTKSRVAIIEGRPLVYDLSGIYQGLGDVIHYIAWREWVVDANRLLGDNAFTRAVQDYRGADSLHILRSWRDAIATNDRTTIEQGIQVIRALRQNVAMANLAFSVTTAIAQLFGITQSMVRVGHLEIGMATLRYMGNFVSMTREARAQSDLMRHRGRTAFRELNELRNKLEARGKIKEISSRWGFVMVTFTQSIVDTITWHAQRDKSLRNGATEADAIAQADRAVKDSQGSGMVMDLSGAERGGELKKVFTIHYNFMNAILNLNINILTSKNQSALRKIANLMTLAIPVAIAEAAFKAMLTPGEDDDWDEDKIATTIAKKTGGYVLGQFVGLRELTTIFDDFDYRGPIGTSPIAQLGKFGTQVGQGELDAALLRATVGAGGAVLGLPSAQINRTLKGAEALSEGETDDYRALMFGYQK